MVGIAVLVEVVEVVAVVMAVWEAKIEEDFSWLIGKCFLMAVACTTIEWALVVEVWECEAQVVAVHQKNRTITEAAEAVNMIVTANFRLALDSIEVLFHLTVAAAVVAMEEAAQAHIIEEAIRQVQCKFCTELMKDSIFYRISCKILMKPLSKRHRSGSDEYHLRTDLYRTSSGLDCSYYH